MKTLRLKLLAATIEWHWIWIKAGRKKGENLLEQGVSLSDPRLLRLDRQITRRGMKAMRATKEYEDLCGLTEELHKMRCSNSCDRTPPIQETPAMID